MQIHTRRWVNVVGGVLGDYTVDGWQKKYVLSPSEQYVLQCASLRYYMQFSIHFYPFTSIAGESLQRTSTGEKRRKGKTASVIRSIKTFLPSFKLLFKRVTKNLFFFLRLCLQSSSVFSSLFFLQVGPFDLNAVPRKRKKDLKLILILQNGQFSSGGKAEFQN